MRSGLFDRSTPPDVFTFHAAHHVLPDELSASIEGESRLAALPGLRQAGHGQGRFRYLLPLMPSYFRHLDLDGYDLVVASSHACAINARPRSDATYVCYIHTPMRYVWMPEVEQNRVGRAPRLALRLFGPHLRRVDRRAAQRPDGLVANSTAVQERIKRFWGRESTVIHPPVEVESFDPSAEREADHFLWVHRLVDYKRPELVAEAFRGMPYRLTMVGTGPLEARLRSSLPPNVELRGWMEQDELIELYARSSGFVHVAEEDFGISVVEALASGTPVIALDRGGARDIIRPGIDGLLIDRPDIRTLREALTTLASRSWDRDALVERAGGFSRARFLTRMEDYVRRHLASRRSAGAR